MDISSIFLALLLAGPFVAALAGVCGAVQIPQKYSLGATLTIALSLICSLVFLGILIFGSSAPWLAQFAWMEFAGSSIPMSFIVDPLAAVMCLVVSFVALLVFIFSREYMTHDGRQGRYFCFLAFFTGSMLGTVVSNSLLTFLIFWEMMGLASYLLIGFWYQKPAAAAAAKKAFLVTRIGDLGLLAAVFFLYNQTGTLLFYDHGAGLLEPAQIALLQQAGLWAGAGYLFWMGLLALWGAMGKSGQFPLHVWLPDAMEGPTPVSALIHAATMVAAGVFLMCRIYPLYENIAGLLTIITWVGTVTALGAALIATAQSDIKRILAYSTVSQLGIMFVGLGVGGPVYAMFHLFTHAFFKSLLFLGSGSVIHACSGEQDIYRMGGLKEKMPKTFLAYALGAAALAGVPLLAGFWSKDEILYRAFEHDKLSFALIVVTSLLTAFYMTRQVVLVFYGKYRGTQEQASHVHESPAMMVIPLMILAVLACVAGFIGTPWMNLFARFLGAPEHEMHLGSHLLMMLTGSFLALVGIYCGYKLYTGKKISTLAEDPLNKWFGKFYLFLNERCRVDELYEATFGRLMNGVSRVSDYFEIFLEFLNRAAGGAVYSVSWISQKVLDEWVINGFFSAGCESARLKGVLAGKLQSGNLSFYLRMMALGAVIAGIIYGIVK